MQKSVLVVQGLELNVNLGWPQEERHAKQLIYLDITIGFPSLPKACETDELMDTICYDQLIKRLESLVLNREYRLIEYLTHTLYEEIKHLLPQHKIFLRLKKNVAALPQIKNGVCFSYGDEL